MIWRESEIRAWKPKEDMTISQVNAKCEELSGYSRDELEGKMKTTDFIPVEELERIKKYHIGRRKKGLYPDFPKSEIC